MCRCTMDVKLSKQIGDDDVIDDIIKSKIRSTF